MKLKLIIPFLVVILASVGCISVSSVSAATPPTYGSVILDGKPLGFDAKPIIINGNTMVPFRKIFESLNMNVHWDSKTKNITAKNTGVTIQMTLDTLKATVNDKEFTLTQTPFNTPEGTVYVNLRFISQAVGATISWDNTKKIATINTK
ncbi:copper amine oxidase N-terminal domain-containing protein [Paenibacillus tritici]|uniref:copper amine oxidase N-terminal domain-containing protein n=1 Tax=Paenibacillus tritici TaxID=1873425 RepID=UPI001BA4E4B0|nr:copper amine oxidase N-terminal domain-containing protein [Paenibacillus tritici]QUL55679.1 copper amine oxidase N-terminal domain-containing protein [Paenibacillus tritici]